MCPGDALNRQELYFENCKPTMSKSRKTGSKIHADGLVSGIRRVAHRVDGFVGGVSSPMRAYATV